MNRLEKIKYLNAVHVSLGRCPSTDNARRVIRKMILREEKRIALLNKVKFVGQIALGAIFMMALYTIVVVAFLMS